MSTNIRDKTKKALDKILQKKQLVGTTVNGKEVTLAHYKSYVREACRYDKQLFVLVFLGHYLEFPHNRFHLASFDALEDPNIKNLAVAAARGLAKSSVYTTGDLLHAICYATEKYIVLLSDTEAQVVSHVKNILYEVTENSRILSVFGDLLPGKRHASADVVFANDVKLSARGVGSSLRGMRHKAHRPTLIQLDDAEKDETVDNKISLEKNKKWYNKVVSFLGSPKTKIRIIGTLLSEDSLLADIQKLPSFKSMTYPAILQWDQAPQLWDQWKKLYCDKDNLESAAKAEEFYATNETEMLLGTDVIWPEKEDYLALQKKIVEIGRPSFMQEYQMQPIDLSKVLFPEFYYFDFAHDPYLGQCIKTHHGKLISLRALDVHVAIDPTAGAKDAARGDATSIILAFVEATVTADERRLFVFKDWTRNARPSEWIRKLFLLAEENNATKIVVEENLYRNFLGEVFTTARKQLREEGLIKREQGPVIKQLLNQTNKEKRIINLEPKISSGKIQFCRSGLTTDFWGQMKSYVPNGHSKDDVPDCLEMLWSTSRGYTAAGVIT